MNSNGLILALIFLGSALMVVNIFFYIRFEQYVRHMWGKGAQVAGLHVPIALLVLFLIGYLFVGIFGKPDIVMASILFGGSVFVFIIIKVLKGLAENVHASEDLRVELQAAERANRAKTVFLSNMSHDIRTPLNAIIGYSALAESGSTDETKLREYIDKIGIAGRHLLDLINDVLEMSRIESGRMHLEEAPADIQSILDEVSTVFDDQMKAKGLNFSVDSSGVTDRYVVCDRVRFTRVIMNLISNAYKYTPEGGTVSVLLTEGDRKDGRADYVLRVKDNGIGMSKEFAARVFDSFERERTSTVSNVQGTGLGMAITQRIVQMMGGTIEVETEQGKGTEFTVRVNLETASEGDLNMPVKHEPHCDCAQGMRLLLAEDVEVNAEIAVMMLTSMGFEVETAVNGREAVDKVMAAEPGHYYAVLMDIQMPVMNGYEATELIRSLPEPELASLPIIAITANAFAEDVQKALDVGMNGHIAKPLDKDNIRRVLKEVFDCELS